MEMSFFRVNYEMDCNSWATVIILCLTLSCITFLPGICDSICKGVIIIAKNATVSLAEVNIHWDADTIIIEQKMRKIKPKLFMFYKRD